jgi:Trk-type K+ transport system membrane component
MAITAGVALGFLELDAALAETMFVLDMWVGRLEIIPVLVFRRAAIAGLDP